MFHEKLDVKLIRQVRDNPVLYNYNHEKYMDFNAREVAWQKIGDELKRPAADCKVRWINIRDVHRRILRKNLINSSRVTKAYKYENELSFLTKFYKDVAPPINCVEDDRGSEWSIVLSDDNDIPEVSYSDDSDKPVKKIKTNRRKPKKQKEIKYNEEEKQATSICSETQTTEHFDVSDSVDAFLLSIGAVLKTFSPYYLNLAKTKIFEIVQEQDLEQVTQRESEQSDVKASSSNGMYIV